MEENAENQIKNTNKKKDYVILKFCVITDLEGGDDHRWKITSGYRLTVSSEKLERNLPREAIWPLGSNCFFRDVRTTLCEISWWL